MSLLRLVYYSAMISAWAAFLGWGVSEIARSFFATDPVTNSTAGVVLLGFLVIAVTSGTTGAAIGLGLNVLGGMANGRWRQLARRALPGLLGGCIGGVAGGMVGGVMFYCGLPRAIGWMVLGLGVGAVEGIYDRSFRKIRNGLIGGAAGGLIGGLLFDSIYNLELTASGRSCRAAAFIVLGLLIGAAIGLAQVVFRVAWLTVVDGYRTGRQLNLTQPVTVLGRADHLPLPFLGPTNKDLESEHLTIRCLPDGSYCLEDNHSKLGTRLNSQPVAGPMPLKDGDIIRLGTNLVRFNERRRRSGETGRAAATIASQPPAPPPPPPPPPAAPSSADKVFSPAARPWNNPRKPPPAP
ncbi:MAG: FHA domain-containing protein [Thermoguttaceae bacterium]